MPRPFAEVRERLERQYLEVEFDPASGLSKEELFAELNRHRAEHPEEPRILTRAWLFHLLCSRARIAVDPEDYFVDQLEHHNLLLELRNEWWREEEGREFANDSPPAPGTCSSIVDTSHTCPNWRNLLRYGIRGLRDRVAGRPGAFYEAVALVYEGVLVLLQRFEAARPSPVLRSLIAGPPQTFHEALQLAYLYHELQEMEGEAVRSMGRFDLLYHPFYAADLEADRLTREQAKELLKYFWIKFFAKTQGKMFGKPFLLGPEVNELSYLALEAFREMHTTEVKLHLRVGEHTPPEFLDAAAECLQAGATSLEVLNDRAQVEMLCQHGRSQKDAEDYIIIGCCEPAVMGQEMNCSGAAALNLAKPVEMVLVSGEYDCFEDLRQAYLETLGAVFARCAEDTRRRERLWPRINPSPLLSGTMDSCLEQGRDVSEAGAKYNVTGCTLVGLANAVDSLAAIRHLVYEERRCTLAELRQALAANWEGYEELRLAALHRAPKWGNNDDRVDQLAVQITDFIGPRINREPNARGGVFHAALFGIIGSAKFFGEQTGALPDGRLAGTPLTMNTSATTGRDRGGVTSLINSVTKLDLSQFPMGTTLDLTLHPSVAKGEEGRDNVGAIIRSHFAQGGMALQFNLFDAGVLREAQRNPEQYASLQVRLCGWNVRFVDLALEEQELFITRAEAAG
ncbi:MAG: hypothetical protein GX100_02705 [candidate division WS1 bacterium]|nr:hypothetical protein [candidate division WS1 bacterium]